jgi:hypothetical protein
MTLRGISEDAHGSAKISNLGQNRISANILGRRFRTQISRSSVQQRCFHPSIFEHFGKIDFFNRIGQKHIRY